MAGTASVPVFMRIGHSGETFKVGTIEFDMDVTETEARAELIDLPGFLRAMADEIETSEREVNSDAPAHF